MTEEATPGRTDASRRIPSGGRLRERVVAAGERAGRLAGRPDVELVTVHADRDEDTVVGPASRRRQPDCRQASAGGAATAPMATRAIRTARPAHSRGGSVVE